MTHLGLLGSVNLSIYLVPQVSTHLGLFGSVI